jgi:predicted small integral membrane protein
MQLALLRVAGPRLEATMMGSLLLNTCGPAQHGDARGGADVVTQTERGDRMFLQMLGSVSDHLIRHGPVD